MTKEYVIDREANKVTRIVKSKGQEYTATAVCNDGDIFNEDIGKTIVDYRLEVQQRKRDLKLTNDFIKRMDFENTTSLKANGRKGTTKHYMLALQNACDERDSQRENIKYCEMRLKQLTSGDYLTGILSLFEDGRISMESTTQFIKEWAVKK